MQADEKPTFIDQQTAQIRWLKSFEQKDSRRFFSSGFPKHDQTAGKFQRGAFHVIAARPGIGKTSYLVAISYHQAKAGTTAYYITMEMPVEALWHRLACLHADRLTLRELTEGEFSDCLVSYIINLSTELEKFSPLFFENSDYDAFEKAVIATVKPSSDSILLIDYLGLFSMRRLGPEQRYFLVSEIAQQLKLLTRTLDIPVITAVQLNRDIEKRSKKNPILADLRDSGDIENHADAVFALTREQEVLSVDILKNRNGPLGAYTLHFDGPRAAVEEFER